MAKLGSSQTTKFSIGTAELRLGALTAANLLAQTTSVGLIDDATYTIEQENVDLEGGFPRTIVDTSIVRQAGTITATLREYSRRNLRIMLGDGLAGASPADVVATASTDTTAGSTTIILQTGEGALFTAGEVVVVYPAGRPEDVSILEIDSIAVETLTFVTNQTTLVDYNGTTETVHVYNAQQVPIGNVTQTNYFSAMLIQKENSTGRPATVSFWKTATSGSLEVATNAEDYASMAMELKVLEPATSEYGAGGDLEHLAGLIPTHPSGMLAYGAD